MDTLKSVNATEIDEGLRQHMTSVYALIAKGFTTSAVVAWVIGHTFLNSWFIDQDGLTTLGIVGILAPLMLLLLQSTSILKQSLSTSKAVFWLFVSLKGLMLYLLTVFYSQTAIVQALSITACAVAGLSLYGYTTRRNLSAMASFLFMGLIGIIATSLLNIFIGSNAIDFAVDVMAAIVFSGYIAWETQAVKEAYDVAHREKLDLRLVQYEAALTIYISIMGLFRAILNLVSSD